MDVRQLRYFVAVAETRSISRAAARCGVAQPSLSQQLQRLERRLGHRLFDRLPRGVALTDAGRALLPRARRVLAELRAAETAIADDLEAGRGRLIAGAIPTMAPYLLPPLVDRFRRRFPDCELTIREDFTERLVEALIDHELDVAIMSTPIDNPLIQVDVVGREELLLASAARPKRNRRPPTKADELRKRPAIVLHEMHCLGQQIESFCAARRLTRRVVCRSTQLDTIMRLVARDIGISFIPAMAAKADTSRKLRYESLGRRGPSREIAIAYHVDRTRSRVSRAFSEMLRDHLADESARR
ncbi:MAG: LysR family transcriptional regulator [Planctomycetota bacterium]|nr:MAG: LysR family transcriptional regulator [Planctomycetota bacterium]